MKATMATASLHAFCMQLISDTLLRSVYGHFERAGKDLDPGFLFWVWILVACQCSSKVRSDPGI